MEEFDLKRFAKTAWQKKWLIIAIMIVSVIAGYIYSYYMITPKYQSTTTIVLTKVESAESTDNQDSITQSDITMNQSLIDTYRDIVKSKKIAKAVKENLGLENISEDGIINSITVTASETTSLLKISVSNEDAELAKNLANEIAKVFSEQIKEYYKINNVNIVDEAEMATSPYNIHHTKDLAIFFVLGLFISGGLVLVLYMLDTTIKTPEDVEKQFKVPVLVAIPRYNFNMEKGGKKK